MPDGGGEDPGTCNGYCGKYFGSSAKCQCDSSCKQYKDCCSDFDQYCPNGAADAGSSSGSSSSSSGGTDAGSSSGSSSSSSGGSSSGTDAGSGTSTSCVGKCGKYQGTSAPCQCDAQCAQYGDCCKDFTTVCAGQGAPKCGDNKIEGNEQCDGSSLDGMKCVGLGYGGGTLKCSNCKFDTSGCTKSSCTSKIPKWQCTSGDSVCKKLELFSPTNGYGYVVTHGTKFSWLRHDTTMLVKYAAASVACMMPGVSPLGMGDMSMSNGGTPAVNGQLRHPKSTHDGGRDIDIAYYQVNTPNNKLRAVCDHKINGVDQYHCTKAPDKLDAKRTALFIGKLMESDRVRVIGVDGKIAQLVVAEAKKLAAQGLITQAALKKFDSHLAYEVTDTGKGWYKFHHHHLHLSTHTWKYGSAPPPPPVAGSGKAPMPPKIWPID